MAQINTDLFRKQYLQLQLVIDNLPMMVAYVDSSNIYRVVNRSYHAFFGVNENEYIGKHTSEVLGNSLYHSVKKYIRNVLTGSPVQWEVHHKNCDSNTDQILHFKLTPYIDAEGECQGYLVVVEDITSVKRMQLALEAMNQTLEHQVEVRTFQLRKELRFQDKLEKKLRKLADHDPLTGLLNRRAFIKQLDKEISRSIRYRTDLSYMIIDIDNFKSINDTYGHITGDAVLKNFSKIVAKMIRSSDFVGRIGGEEFAIAMPGTKLKLANEMGERIRKGLAEQPIRCENAEINCTVSIGISRYLPDHRTSMEMHSLADSALYQAKNNGRNRVCVVL